MRTAMWVICVLLTLIVVRLFKISGEPLSFAEEMIIYILGALAGSLLVEDWAKDK